METDNKTPEAKPDQYSFSVGAPSGVSKSKFKQKNTIIILIVLLSVAVSFITLCSRSTKTPGKINLRTSVDRAGVDGGVGGEGSDEFNQKVEEKNKQATKKAIQSGKSSVPILTGRNTPEPKKIDPEPDLKPKEVRPLFQKSKSTRRPETQVRTTKSHEHVVDYMRDLTKFWNKEPSATLVIYPVQQDDDSPDVDEASDDVAPTSLAKSFGLQPGSILYAVNQISIDSDSSPSFVRGEIISGELRGATVLGGYNRQEDMLIVEFKSIVLPDGRPISIRGYAVDTQSSLATLRTSVDRHYIERYVLPAAADFIRGFGEVIAQSGSTVTQTYSAAGTTTITDMGDLGLEEQAMVAAGSAADSIARALEKNQNRPPTVYLAPGQDFAIVLAEVK